MLTQHRLKELFDYDRVSGCLIWRTTGAGRKRAVAGYNPVPSLYEKEYIQIRIEGKLYKAHRLVWLYVHGKWPKNDVDHIDGNSRNNRVENLREATMSQNLANRSAQNKNNTSGHRGVYFDKSKKKWCAEVTVVGKKLHLGTFSTIEQAALTAQRARLQHFGEFANG